MKRFYLLFTALILIPSFAHAQSLQVLFTNILVFINRAVIPFILGIAFLFFAINAIRYFVIESDTEDGREKAKNLAIYSVLAFVVILLFWGIVNLLSQSIGLEGKNAVVPDYIQRGGGATPTPTSPTPTPPGPAPAGN
jgi:succinate dehydrogenase/fumarate reductase cytochrome b subunit